MGEMMKKFREFQNEVFGSGCNVICNVEVYRMGEDTSVEISVYFIESREQLKYEVSSWFGESKIDWEEFKEQVRAKL